MSSVQTAMAIYTRMSFSLSAPFLDKCCACSQLLMPAHAKLSLSSLPTCFAKTSKHRSISRPISTGCQTKPEDQSSVHFPYFSLFPSSVSTQLRSWHNEKGSLNKMKSHSSSRMFSTEQASRNQTPPKKKSADQSKKSPISWKTLLIVAGLGGAFAVGLQMVKKEKEEEMKKSRTRQMGKALLGGDWILTDHHGNRRSSREFRGQWILIYFGFTNCPDICPEEIEKIVRVINQTDSDKDLPKIQPIVITVDPDRDTPEALKEYCSEFSPRLLGFTGTVEEITAATRAYRVYFSAGPKDEDNDYIVDHSIISYLVNPEGEFAEYFGQNKTSSEIYNSIKLHISSYNVAEKRKK